MFDELRPPEALLYLILGKWYGQAITAAAQLGIADLLADGPHTSDEVARASGANPEAIYRIMRCLGAVGVFYETAGKKFELTPIGAALRKDAPGLARGPRRVRGCEVNLDACAELTHSARTGHSAFTKAHGMPIFEWMPAHPEEAAIYNSAMASLSTTTARAVAAAYDFSTAKSIVDIGGGHGTLLAEDPERGAARPRRAVRCAARRRRPRGPARRARPAERGARRSAATSSRRSRPATTRTSSRTCSTTGPMTKRSRSSAQIARAMTPGGKLLIVEQLVTPPGGRSSTSQRSST